MRVIQECISGMPLVPQNHSCESRNPIGTTTHCFTGDAIGIKHNPFLLSQLKTPVKAGMLFSEGVHVTPETFSTVNNCAMP